jgi:putative phosphoribosyl transferase
LGAIGYYYADFTQVTDEDVVRVLRDARAKQDERAGAGHAGSVGAGNSIDRSVKFRVDGAILDGDLAMPKLARGLVLFAHGSGSSRHSPRNRFVAEALHRAGLGTLLLDLLTAHEEATDELTGHLRFDIDFLARRLIAATDWAREDEALKPFALGYFGASTGAAAALVAAAKRPKVVRAVVSRGGRPDLAMEYLPRVHAPTLLIVGSADVEVLAMNEEAYSRLRCEKDIAVVEGATHLFEEPGALAEVATLAAKWFVEHLEVRVVRAAS